MNYGLNFPIENYAALYIAIVNSVDTETALAKVIHENQYITGQKQNVVSLLRKLKV
mgnify:CR=1 FL=1